MCCCDGSALSISLGPMSFLPLLTLCDEWLVASPELEFPAADIAEWNKKKWVKGSFWYNVFNPSKSLSSYRKAPKRFWRSGHTLSSTVSRQHAEYKMSTKGACEVHSGTKMKQIGMVERTIIVPTTEINSYQWYQLTPDKLTSSLFLHCLIKLPAFCWLLASQLTRRECN